MHAGHGEALNLRVSLSPSPSLRATASILPLVDDLSIDQYPLHAALLNIERMRGEDDDIRILPFLQVAHAIIPTALLHSQPG